MTRPVPDPYRIHFELLLADGSKAGSTDASRVSAEDVYNSQGTLHITEQGSVFNFTGTLSPLALSNIPAFQARTRPNLRFHVWTGSQIIHTTQVFHAIPAESTVLVIIGVGDALLDAPDEEGSNRVFGRVANTLDLPVQGLRVLTFHVSWTKDGITEQALGSALTDGAGRYSLTYDLPLPTAASIACSHPADQLNIIAYARDPESTSIAPLASTRVVFAAVAEQALDLVVDRASVRNDSEYQRLTDKLGTCLGATEEARNATLDLLDGRPEYLVFVAQSIGEDEGSVRAYVRGSLIAREIDEKVAAAEEELSKPMSPEAMFGLVRFGYGDRLYDLLDVRPTELYDALVEVIHKGFVSVDLEATLQRSSRHIEAREAFAARGSLGLA